MIEKLVEITPRPWAEYGRGGKPITQNKLARLLKPLGITPQQIRVGVDEAGKDIQVRGYRKVDFQEAFERFLPPEGVSNRHTVTTPDGKGTSEIFKPSQAKNAVTVAKCEKSNNDGLCDTVTVAKGGPGERARSNGQGPGLSQRDIDRQVAWYNDAAHRDMQAGREIDTGKLDAELRRRLAELVLPEHIDTEFQRVMDGVYGPSGQMPPDM
jgi:hypothetical protein